MNTTVVQSRLVRTGNLGPLTESIIPAVPGKFYAYQPTFTLDKPLYALLDCKANKSRTIAQASELGREVHMLFEFDDAFMARVSSIKATQDRGLFAGIEAEFDHVWVAPAPIEIEDFYSLCAKRDSARLVEVCMEACSERQKSIGVAPGMVVALMTSGRKYGLFLVKELTPTSVSIDACHVLLP
jgi:hypothetical protein